MRTGDHIDDFSLPDDRGGTWTLSHHRGRPVLVIFHRHLM